MLPRPVVADVEVDSLARAWVKMQVDLQRAPNTVAAYSRGLEHYLNFCRNAGTDAVRAGRSHIAAYIGELAGRSRQIDESAGNIHARHALANASIRHRLTIVRLFYDYLLEEGLRPTNPVARGQRGARYGGIGASVRGLVPVQRRLPWIPDEVAWRAVLEAARAEPVRNRLMLSLAYDCALRREELCLLETGDFDPARRLLSIRAETTKTKQGRVVPYSEASAALYSAYLPQRRLLGSARGPLFLSASTRNRAAPLTKWTWSKVVRALAIRAGEPKLTTHSFRHLCLTDLARAGWDIHEIARFAGHRSLQSTLLYIHLSARDLSQKFALGMAALHDQRMKLMDEAFA